MINIEDIIDKSMAEIVDIILDQKVQPIIISVPKTLELAGSTSDIIATEYLNLAFAGQLLAKAATDFHYEFIMPAERENVLFEVETSKIEELADALYKVSLGYKKYTIEELRARDWEYEYDFHDNILHFIDDIKNGKVEPACKDFYTLFLKYNKKAEQEYEDDKDEDEAYD